MISPIYHTFISQKSNLPQLEILMRICPPQQQGMPMRQPMMGQPGAMPSGMGSGTQQQSHPSLQQQISTDHQNGKNNVQLDPFGAF